MDASSPRIEQACAVHYAHSISDLLTEYKYINIRDYDNNSLFVRLWKPDLSSLVRKNKVKNQQIFITNKQ